MFEKFYPDYRAMSSYDIDFEGKYDLGYRGIIFDIDNTLTPHGADADERSIALMKRLKNCGFKICFLSNNKEPRVAGFCEGLRNGGVDMYGVYHISKAGKPSVKNYQRAMEMMGTVQRTTLFVGDQLFTDLWGAKKAGIYSVLVKPINPKEEVQIVLKRYLEKVVLRSYERKRKKALSKKAIMLIGFMGCGKTTVGKKLAESLEYKLMDMDELIEQREKMTVSEIFETKGEDYFRNIETGVLSEMAGKVNQTVISTGGGMPIRPANHRPLKECGIVVYLKTSAKTVLDRLEGDTTRPLLQRPDKEAAVHELLAEREPVYGRLADVTVVTDGKTAERIVEEIKLAL